MAARLLSYGTACGVGHDVERVESGIRSAWPAGRMYPEEAGSPRRLWDGEAGGGGAPVASDARGGPDACLAGKPNVDELLDDG